MAAAFLPARHPNPNPSTLYVYADTAVAADKQSSGREERFL